MMYPIQDRSLYFIEFGIKLMLLSQFDIQLLIYKFVLHYDIVQIELYNIKSIVLQVIHLA